MSFDGCNCRNCGFVLTLQEEIALCFIVVKSELIQYEISNHRALFTIYFSLLWTGTNQNEFFNIKIFKLSFSNFEKDFRIFSFRKEFHVIHLKWNLLSYSCLIAKILQSIFQMLEYRKWDFKMRNFYFFERNFLFFSLSEEVDVIHPALNWFYFLITITRKTKSILPYLNLKTEVLLIFW
jgi:hypothetical protein